MYIPKYDKGFKPAIIALKEFNEKVEKSGEACKLVICLERTNANNYIYEMNIFKDNTGHDEENFDLEDVSVRRILMAAGTLVDYTFWRNELARYAEMRANSEAKSDTVQE